MKKEYVTFDVMTHFVERFYGTIRLLKTPFKISFRKMVEEMYRKYPTLKGVEGVVMVTNDKGIQICD